jgi:hypothetical protein
MGFFAMLCTLRLLLLSVLIILATPIVVAAEDDAGARAVREEIWALLLTLPTLVYVVHPVGKEPFPLVIMNHRVSYTGAGGDAEYHLMPPLGSEGHFFIDHADTIFSTGIHEPPTSQGDEHEGPVFNPAAIDHQHGARVISAPVRSVGCRTW